MKFLVSILLFFALNNLNSNERKIVILLNENNNCLGCNIAIGTLLEKISKSKIHTVVYLNGLNKVQVRKINSDLDLDLESSFNVINQKEKYSSIRKSNPRISSINSYLLIYENDEFIRLYDLVELVKNKVELNKLSDFMN